MQRHPILFNQASLAEAAIMAASVSEAWLNKKCCPYTSYLLSTFAEMILESWWCTYLTQFFIWLNVCFKCNMKLILYYTSNWDQILVKINFYPAQQGFRSAWVHLLLLLLLCNDCWKNSCFLCPMFMKFALKDPFSIWRKFLEKFLPPPLVSAPMGQFWTFFGKSSFFIRFSPNLDRRNLLVYEMSFW